MSTAVLDSDMHVAAIHSPSVMSIPSVFPISETKSTLAPAHHQDDIIQSAAPFNLSDSQVSAPAIKDLPGRQITPPTPMSIHTETTSTGVHDTSPNSTAGKKRTATGEIKESQTLAQEALRLANGTYHARTDSNISTASNGTVSELSQQLRTRLTYAMLKVQNGWQNRSLDEVESLASQSPRSTAGLVRQRDGETILSPRVDMSPHLHRQQSGSSSSSDTLAKSKFDTVPPAISNTSQSGHRSLAPPADIVAGQRRRQTPNIHLQPLTKNSNQNGASLRPMGTVRTPSQNAAMEADAVETLLFMASPNNSGHHPFTFSPITSAPSSQYVLPQNSPLRSQFSNIETVSSPKRVAFSSDIRYTGRVEQDKDALLNSLVDKLDDEDSAELDEAVRVMDHYHTAKLST